MLSKEHYGCKIHTLLMKSGAYPPSTHLHPSIDNPLYGLHPLLPENLDPAFYDFSKIEPKSYSNPNKWGFTLCRCLPGYLMFSIRTLAFVNAYLFIKLA